MRLAIATPLSDALGHYPLTPSTARCRLQNARRGDRDQTKALPEVVERIGVALLESHPGWAVGLGANSVVYVTGIKVLLNGLTWAGVMHSWFLGSTVYAAFGLGGYSLVCLYFIIGSLVTKVKLEQKKREGVAEERSGRRSIGSVWGSGFAGVICALLALITGRYDLFQIGFVASFGSKLSDTVSSEIGKAYGKTTFLVTTFEKCPRGTEGAISLEGTAAGISAALTYSLLAYAFRQIARSEIWIVLVSCIVSNFVESFVGASFQGNQKWMTNDVVNGIQISLASLLAIGLRRRF